MISKIKNLIFFITILTFIAYSGIAAAKNKKITNNRSSVKSSLVASKSKAKFKQININTANFNTLQKIKGMSKTKARAIINYRTQNGPFRSVKDLLKIKCRGIHEKWLSKVKRLLTM